MTVTGSPRGLDAAQRTQLDQLVTRARTTLAVDLRAQAEGRFGIHADGTVEDEQALPDDASDQATRRDLVEIIDHICSLGESRADAVARLLREAAFTHLNRLLAIRIAEAIGLLPESLAKGRQSRGFRELGEIMPILGDDYWGYLLLCGDELAADAPALFDPRNPLLALAPSTAAFDELVTSLADPATSEIWSPRTRSDGRTSTSTLPTNGANAREASAPRNSRELAVRNQFFTPGYVVDFLVQNTLGRRMIESDPTSGLLNELPLLVDPPTEAGPLLNLEEVTVLDPACGSGHFLLGCYDLLERAWKLAGVAPSDAAPKIVTSLWGVDIDARCAQVASAAIVFRARRHCRDAALPRPNIVTARGLPGGSSALPADLELAGSQRRLVDRISESLSRAPLLGALLKAEATVADEIRHSMFGSKPGVLELSDQAAGARQSELLTHLQALADRASSSVGDRLLAAEADDALRLIDVVRRRYDVVVMNPPLSPPASGSETYLRTAYPASHKDLGTAFCERALELVKPEGMVGAIANRTAFFLTTFAQWRETILNPNRLVAMVDLGWGVIEDAKVELIAYVASPTRRADHVTVFSLLAATDKPAALYAAVEGQSRGSGSAVFFVGQDDLGAIPGSPYAYWVSQSMRNAYSENSALEGAGAQVRQGLATADDFRFLRLRWEPRSERIGADRAWAPFAKGGQYSPYWADVYLVVDWESDGKEVKEFERSVIRNSDFYFRLGVTWPRFTTAGFGPRLLPEGCVFADKGPAAFPIPPSVPLVLLGYLASRPVKALLELQLGAGEGTSSGTSARGYEVGALQRLPWPERVSEDEWTPVAEATADLVALVASWSVTEETSAFFAAPVLRGTVRDSAAAALDRREEEIGRALDGALDIDQRVFRYLGLRDTEELARVIGRHPSEYDDAAPPAAEFRRLYELPTNEVISEIVKQSGGARHITTPSYVLDRHLELLAHALNCSPKRLATMRADMGLLRARGLEEAAEDVLSYLVGCALGRWDARVALAGEATHPAVDPFGPPPARPPGMLVSGGGTPHAQPPPGYPLTIPPDGILLDEPGHQWDIDRAVQRAAALLFPDPDGVLQEATEIVGARSLRGYLNKRFFRDHLSRYSRSRRKAPLYWSLTVPSRNWGVWVYPPMLNREMLYAVQREAERRERLGGEAIARLRRELAGAETRSSSRRAAAELDAEERLTEELRLFGAEADRIAGLGWEPDLDDGILLCAAPLADLFPAWPDAKNARTELRKRQHGWATVAQWAGEL